MRLKTFAIGLSVCAMIALIAPTSEAARPGQRAQVSNPGWGDCVRTVRALSDFTIRGDAWTWWNTAAGQYERDSRPVAGSVLVFKRSRHMGRGHVSLVSKVVDSRTVLVDHTWIAGRGIKRGMKVVDVSDNNDWSAVRVWHGPTDQLGQRVYGAYGFILPEGGKSSGIVAAVDRGDEGPAASRFDAADEPASVAPRGRKAQTRQAADRASLKESPAVSRMFSPTQVSALMAVPPARKPVAPGVKPAVAKSAGAKSTGTDAAKVAVAAPAAHAVAVPARKPATRVAIKKDAKENVVVPARKPKAA